MMAYCQKCGRITRHHEEKAVNYFGVVTLAERCVACGQVGGSHEAPIGDPPSLHEAGITPMDYRRMEFLKHLISRGIVADDDRVYRAVPLAGKTVTIGDGKIELTGGVMYVRMDRCGE